VKAAAVSEAVAAYADNPDKLRNEMKMRQETRVKEQEAKKEAERVRINEVIAAKAVARKVKAKAKAEEAEAAAEVKRREHTAQVAAINKKIKIARVVARMRIRPALLAFDAWKELVASGAYLSARAKERFPMNREKKRTVDLILMVVTLLAATCILAIAPFQSNRWLLLGFIALGCTFLFMGSTSVTMTILTSVPKNMKASATALMTLGIHAFGDVPFTPLLGLLKTTLAPKCDFIDEKLNPACPEDIAGLRYTFLACVCWLFWAVLLWGVAALIDIFRPAGTFMNYEGGTFDSFMAADGVEPIMDPPPRGSSLALLRNNEGSRRSSSGSDSDPGSKV